MKPPAHIGQATRKTGALALLLAEPDPGGELSSGRSKNAHIAVCGRNGLLL